MAPAEPAATSRLQAVPLSAAKTRIIAAALELFAEHGVNGTSLQMIADAIGVTKAAVYHQFNTKAEIVGAAAEVELAKLELVLEAAEVAPSRQQSLDILLVQLIDFAVERRRWVGALQGDPVMIRFLAEHEPFMLVMERLYRVLIGDQDSPQARVPAAMISAAIGGAVLHPLVVDLDDETLRSELLRLARRLLDPAR
jgi:AcrR family transcriptional regulator